MLSIALLVALRPQDSPVMRDEYGVPHIKASSPAEAFYWAGYATAEDRLWQMETSRRLARGRMAEVFGKQYAASDTEILKSFYTDEELLHQFNSCSPELKTAIENYGRGINDFISKGKLPPGYTNAGFAPDPWQPIDTVAITVRLFQQFGKGGAGEIRNLALLGYLQTRAETKDRALDVLNDFSWQNDPSATPTVPPSDDPLRTTPPPAEVPRATSQKQIAALPKFGLFELLPGVRLALHEDSSIVAEQMSAPFKMGSYAVVVGPQRSATGHPLLLSAPQMGHRAPSILHEMSIDAPGLSVAGVDVPGVPGVIIGKTSFLAWGLTSGVADTDDIFYSKLEGTDGYLYGKQSKKLTTLTRTLKVKGEPDQQVIQQRTVFGPVVIKSAGAGALLSRKSSYWMREMKAAESIFALYRASTPTEIDASVHQAPMSFNFFWATKTDFGYRYVGAVPIRARGLDPRFPTPGEPEYDWKGFLNSSQMPHVINPKSGFLANWNNKPVSWWPNGDTPVWGRIFRNSALLQQVGKPRLDEYDLEQAAFWIARLEPTWPYLKPLVQPVVAEFRKRQFIQDPGPVSEAMEALSSFDGRMVAGSAGATVYGYFLDALREEIFLATTGNFVSPDNFRLVTQPTIMLRALEKKTIVNYLGTRTAREVVEAAIRKAGERIAGQFGRDLNAWRYQPSAIRWGEERPVPYSDRGTMIQVIDLGHMYGRNVVPPGVSESGAHAFDQVPLARGWHLKPMRNRP